MGLTLGEMAAEIREVNITLGWRSPEGGPSGNTFGDYIALLHSEPSEALEAYRDHRLADATKPICGNEGHTGNPCPEHGMGKPEGVGSEFADTLIRLVDMCDVFGIKLLSPDLRLADVEDFADVEYRRERRSFGDWVAWLHYRIVEMDLSRNYQGAYVLRALVTTARHFQIDLEAEYVRKIAYNRTRSFQHGGRTLGESADPRLMSGGGKTTRFNALWMAMPVDPRGWWASQDTERFITQWERLGLPELTLQDGQGETLMLWCADVQQAADLIDMKDHVTNDVSFSITRGEYVASIVQADKKETKDA